MEMDKEVCIYFEPISRKDKLCKYFTGDRASKNHLDRCRHYCSMMDSADCMKERSYSRHKGALKQK